ncbi:helix-turn-helix transcriptional regulator [Alicyclobacillus mali]|uniref:Helix-turn-helix transcriptional regulator n=1 Tax=Alicyclobacillus mali (ex Roth et al. 2021) TaxID=1123961 RepID=A0ABS0EZK3_9BACL|nr:helix-turn-helix transcriptional regulator [Alicyclobacillus mali (ex Roth et al. 2021)]MBF8376484.1 helix-turn-helix transcriptional regulator [Alicyclobacillus mali (ex Roth et al. 2021)]
MIHLREEFIKRYLQDVSIRQVAGDIGISTSMMYLLIQKKRNPGSKVVSKILEYYKLTFEEVFTTED